MEEMEVAADTYFSWEQGLWTLFHLKFARHIKVTEVMVVEIEVQELMEMINIEVPLGTVVKDKETGEILFEITEDGENKCFLEVVKVV
jgi:GTP-binding protein